MYYKVINVYHIDTYRKFSNKMPCTVITILCIERKVKVKLFIFTTSLIIRTPSRLIKISSEKNSILTYNLINL